VSECRPSSWHAVLVSQTEQTWALVAATLGGVIVAFIGSGYLQHSLAKRDERGRLRNATAELLAAVEDLLSRMIILRHARSSQSPPKMLIHFGMLLLRDWPFTSQNADLDNPFRLQPAIGAVADMDRWRIEQERATTMDVASAILPSFHRYLTVAGLLMLGGDKLVADAVRELTLKVTVQVDSISTRQRQFERSYRNTRRAMEEFRKVADKRLGGSERRTKGRG
jgi:hypothetical protein